jgi:hypothetical protein
VTCECFPCQILIFVFSSKTDLEINAENTKYMIMSRHLNSGQNQNIRIANESFENVAKIQILGDDANKSE